MSDCPYHRDIATVDGRCPACEAESKWVTWDAPPERVLAPEAEATPVVHAPAVTAHQAPDNTYRPPIEQSIGPDDVESRPPQLPEPIPHPTVHEPTVGCLGYGLAMIGFPVVFAGDDGNRSWPWTTLIVAAVIAAVGIIDMVQFDNSLAWSLAYRPGRSSILAIFTVPLAHFGIFHLVGNLWFLLAFGRVVERWMSHVEVAALLIVGGVLSTVLQVVASAPGTALGGASGAIAALFGATLIHAPETKVSVKVGPFVRAAPVLLWAGLWFANQSLGALSGAPGIGWVAHMSGFLVGIAFAVALNVLDMMHDDDDEELSLRGDGPSL